MSKSKPRAKDEIYHLKRHIAELNDTIQKLERKLNNEAKAEKKKPKAKETVEVEKPTSDCPECHDGKMTVIDLGFKIIELCPICKYRKTVKSG